MAAGPVTFAKQSLEVLGPMIVQIEQMQHALGHAPVGDSLTQEDWEKLYNRMSTALLAINNLQTAFIKIRDTYPEGMAEEVRFGEKVELNSGPSPGQSEFLGRCW